MTDALTAEVVVMLDGEDAEALETVIAVAAGQLAHARGDAHAVMILHRWANALLGPVQ